MNVAVKSGGAASGVIGRLIRRRSRRHAPIPLSEKQKRATVRRRNICMIRPQLPPVPEHPAGETEEEDGGLPPRARERDG
ncbi:MAG: hypothetical protein AB7K86_21610 [Rhodospirillales bacterium]